jgi:hypothetical protein
MLRKLSRETERKCGIFLFFFFLGGGGGVGFEDLGLGVEMDRDAH